MPEQSVAAPPVGTTAPPRSKPSALKRLFQLVVTYVWFIGALFSAGRLNWTRGWVSVVLSVVGMTALGLIVQRYNPELMAERARWRRKDTKRFDKIFMANTSFPNTGPTRYSSKVLIPEGEAVRRDHNDRIHTHDRAAGACVSFTADGLSWIRSVIHAC
jgi:hypothetical protein